MKTNPAIRQATMLIARSSKYGDSVGVAQGRADLLTAKVIDLITAAQEQGVSLSVLQAKEIKAELKKVVKK